MESNQRAKRKPLSKRRKTGWLESYSSESQDDDGYCPGDSQQYNSDSSSDDTAGREMNRRYERRGEQFRKEVDDEAERERREDEEEFGGCGFCQGNHQEMVEEGGQCGDKDQGLTSGQERGEEESEYDGEERPVIVAPAPQPRTKGKTTRTKASNKRNPVVLGAKPSRPVVPKKPAKLTKKEDLKGPVSTHASAKQFKQKLTEANSRISHLESLLEERVCVIDTQHELLVNTDEQYNYIDAQDRVIAYLKSEIDTLTRSIQTCEHAKRLLELEVDASKDKLKLKDEEILRSKREAAHARKNRLTAADQILIQNNKAENDIRVSRKKEKAKLGAHKTKKQNDILRQQDNFQASRKNFKRNKGGKWDVMKEVRVKFWITCF